jgi:glutamate N-acetyltransferase/amino-acid N-acetyltransferase
MTEQITCPGFTAAGVAAAIKYEGRIDLGLLFSERPATVAGVFTNNRVKAAPVLLDMERIKSGICHAVIANSGNANCCTGNQGYQDAVSMAKFAASALGVSEDTVFVASTGVIGAPLPINKIESAVPKLVESLNPEGFSDLAEAIMTTDTVPKVISKTGRIDGKTFTIVATAKGAGMIRPDMATMLCFAATDIQASSDDLSNMLFNSVERSFNRITIDGDTSTNDTVLLLANGESGIEITNDAERSTFQEILDDVMMQLARMLVQDGEGATKLVDIIVSGAKSLEDAKAVAFTIAHSNLVKTALFGEDANWGRIIGAAGRAGVPVDPDRIDIYFNDTKMVENGMGCGEAAEAEATRVIKLPEFKIKIDLKMGEEAYSAITCDFSIDYVKINADYRS